MPNNKDYIKWKAKKLAEDPDFFKHDYQRRVAKYGKEYLNKFSAKWRKEHPEYCSHERSIHREYYAQKAREWRARNKQHHSELVKKWFGEHPEVYEVTKIMTGKRKKLPIAEWCEVCPENDARKATQRHHPDYNYPEIFVSCCHSCHYYLNTEREQLLVASKSQEKTNEGKQQ